MNTDKRAGIARRLRVPSRFGIAVGLLGAMLIVVAAARQPVTARQTQQPSQAQPSAEAAPSIADPAVGRYFTQVQSDRGKLLFDRNCGYCHWVDQNKMPKAPKMPAGHYFSLGGALAPRWLARALNDRAPYPSVYYAFKRFEYMPVNDTQSISQQERADILAYVLQKNGLQPGDEELRPDYAAMKSMILPAEPGFVHLFNGRDIKDWKHLYGWACTPQPEGCGKTESIGVFYVKEGSLITTGRVHGLLYTPDKYKNFTFRVDQRIPIEWDDEGDLLPDQTGWMFFMNGTLGIWPYSRIEVEGRYRDLLGYTSRNFKILNKTEDEEARRRVRNKVTDWNRIQIVSKNGNLKSYLNGELITSADLQPLPEPGFIAFQSQGGPVEWRDVRIKVED